MKKSLIILLVVALVLPLMVSCSDTSKLDKIAKILSDFSGVGQYSAEEVKQQSEEVAAEAKNINFTTTSDFQKFLELLDNNPAADLKQETEINLADIYVETDKISNDLQSDIISKITGLTEDGKTTTTNLTELKTTVTNSLEDSMPELGNFLGNVIGVVEGLSATDKEGKATLGDLQVASAAVNVANSIGPVMDLMTTMTDDNGDMASAFSDGTTMEAVSNFESALTAYASAMVATGQMTEKEAEGYSLMALIPQLIGSAGGDE